MNVGQLVKVAATAGPVVWRLARRAGPILARLRREHPDAYAAVQRQIGDLAQARKERSGPAAMHERVEVLRGQVQYLANSADDEGEARRAAAWSRDLDGVEHALALVATEPPKQSRRHLRQVNQRLDTLSGQILAAFIGEQQDDAEAGD